MAVLNEKVVVGCIGIEEIMQEFELMNRCICFCFRICCFISCNYLCIYSCLTKLVSFQERIQLETSRLYKQAGVNPLAGSYHC